MEYRVIRSEDRSDDAIEHAIFGGGRQKGAQNKNHKYLARAWWRNKWRYAYTEAEVRALQMLGKAKETASEAKEAVKETTAKVKTTAEKAKSVATGNYAKAVDNKASTAKQNIARATEARNQEQQKAASATARKESADNKLFKTKKTQQTSSNASASAERASANAKKYDEARSKAQADLASAAREKETTAYKVSKAVNDTTAKVKSTADKVADTAKDVADKVKDAPRAAAEAVVNASEKAGKTAKKAADIATGKYAKDVDNDEAKAKENYNRAKEDHDKQIQQYKNAKDRIGSNLTSWEKFATPYLNKNARTKIENTANAAERAIDNAEKARVAMGNYKADAERAARKKETTAYKVSKVVNDTTDKVKSAADKGKAKAEELLYGKKWVREEKPVLMKPGDLDQHLETTWLHAKDNNTRSANAEVTRGRKYEGTGHKAEARKEEGGVAGGPVSGNTNMQGRGEEKKTSLKDKVSDFAKKASNAAEAVKLGAHLTKKNVENYLNDDNGKVVTDTAGKSTLKGQKVTTTYSEGNGLLNKSTLTKKQNEDGTVEYEHHTEYGKIAQTAKKGKEAVENLFDDKKTPKYSITPDKLEEYTPPWLEGYHFKNGKMEVDKSVAETFEKGKSKAKEVLDKVSSTAKTTAAKAYDKVTDTAEKVADKVEDIKVNAEHKAYANEMKRKYGADSLHYKDAQAYVEHDKTVSDLQKARDKYGVNSAEYKAAAAKEKAAREKMDDVHEQNLYTNNKEYKKVSDQANALESYIRNMDARGGPQTAEGKANYRKAVQDLEKLEAQLEQMWNEEWE